MADHGYDADFLEVTVRPPSAPPADASEPTELHAPLEYTHFTLRMHPVRRLAWWVAWNIDGLTLFPSESISRAGERFSLDSRIPASAQTGEEAYADNDLDRGHIARRSDLLWGGSLAEARQANTDSFTFTNITPQHQDFNQSGRGGIWGLLENAVLAQDGLQDRRLSVFAGPVLAEDDPLYRGIVRLPREHWKIVVYRLDARLRFKAFLLTQDLDGVAERVVPNFLDNFDTYLVPLDMLGSRTGLDFAGLDGAVDQAELRTVATPVLITEAEQVVW